MGTASSKGTITRAHPLADALEQPRGFARRVAAPLRRVEAVQGPAEPAQDLPAQPFAISRRRRGGPARPVQLNAQREHARLAWFLYREVHPVPRAADRGLNAEPLAGEQVVDLAVEGGLEGRRGIAVAPLGTAGGELQEAAE